jgi:hypothetical protein
MSGSTIVWIVIAAVVVIAIIAVIAYVMRNRADNQPANVGGQRRRRPGSGTAGGGSRSRVAPQDRHVDNSPGNSSRKHREGHAHHAQGREQDDSSGKGHARGSRDPGDRSTAPDA